MEPGPVIQLVSFDVWGTLLQGNPVFKARRETLVAEAFGTDPAATASAMTAAGDDLDAATLRTGRHFGCADRLDRTAALLGVAPLADTAPVEAELGAALRRDPPGLTEPDLPDTLAGLRADGLRLAVTSNTGFLTGAQMRPVLAGLGLLVDHGVFSDEVGHAKPGPEIFGHLAGVAGLQSTEILHVGDNEHADVRGALAAGMHALWYRPHGEPAPGVAVIHRLTDVRERLSDFDPPGTVEA
jgi:putative hydrolase of the HAD superfamily